MRPRFESCLETNEIPYGAGYHGPLTLGREPCCQGFTVGRKRLVQAPDPVRRGIRDGEVGESTAGDLIVIIGVTPTPNAAVGIWIPESAVLEI